MGKRKLSIMKAPTPFEHLNQSLALYVEQCGTILNYGGRNDNVVHEQLNILLGLWDEARKIFLVHCIETLGIDRLEYSGCTLSAKDPFPCLGENFVKTKDSRLVLAKNFGTTLANAYNNTRGAYNKLVRDRSERSDNFKFCLMSHIWKCVQITCESAYEYIARLDEGLLKQYYDFVVESLREVEARKQTAYNTKESREKTLQIIMEKLEKATGSHVVNLECMKAECLEEIEKLSEAGNMAEDTPPRVPFCLYIKHNQNRVSCALLPTDWN